MWNFLEHYHSSKFQIFEQKPEWMKGQQGTSLKCSSIQDLKDLQLSSVVCLDMWGDKGAPVV
jgi:hypothetical protein